MHGHDGALVCPSAELAARTREVTLTHAKGTVEGKSMKSGSFHQDDPCHWRGSDEQREKLITVAAHARYSTLEGTPVITVAAS